MLSSTIRMDTFIGITIISLLVLYILNRESSYSLQRRLYELETKMDVKEVVTDSDVIPREENSVVVDMDRQRYENVLEPPLSRNMYMQSSGKIVVPHKNMKDMPINIATRGDGGDYQQLGILYKESIQDNDKAPGNNTDNPVIPLFGKRTYGNSNQWNYYTATDSNHQIKIPLTIDGKNCTDDLGCKEIYDGDSIQLPQYNGNFNATIYKLDKPQYIPYV
jgi:hypothetical protein